jgi:DNA-binding NarL/FixJ family response regulator
MKKDQNMVKVMENVNDVDLKKEKTLFIHSCDDHHIVAEGIQSILKHIPNVELSTSNSKEGLLSHLKNEKVDILILDINVRSQNMIKMLPEIKALKPGVKILLFTNYSTNDIIKEVVRYDIDGFLEKTEAPSKIISCIKSLQAGKKHLTYQKNQVGTVKDSFELLNELTARELDIFKLLAGGKTNKQIADALFISILTVQTHRKRMYQKLGIKGINELITFAYENNLY